jgi:glycosyltransferase involved in cell wall biosynthesis
MVTSFDLLGARYLYAQRGARTALQLACVYAKYGRAFNSRILRHGLGGADTIFGFDGGSLELFHWAKAQGLRCVLEQTIAPRRWQNALLAEESDRWPGWQPNLEQDGSDPLRIREEAEWSFADVVLAPSQFVVEGIAACGGPSERCFIVPYDAGGFGVTGPRGRRRERTDRLRVLFVGEVGLRKGAPYALEALRRLGSTRVESRFAGRVEIAAEKIAKYKGVAEFLGHVPRSRVVSLYHWADILILPSLCEGSASVTYEALAAGLPVVCTPNTGSIVRDGIDGLIIPPRDVDSLTSAIDAFVREPGLVSIPEDTGDRVGSPLYAARLFSALGATP